VNIVLSKNKVRIRLTGERWIHIIESHNELAGRMTEVLETVAEPDIIFSGSKNEFLAAKKSNKHWIVTVYKEVNEIEGFIITAFVTSRINYLLKKDIVWKKPS
jgi:hypothetical protein